MIKVLLIEDDVEIARIIKYFLAMEDMYDVKWAQNVQEALKAARDSIDIILLDVLLPDGNGISLCSQLREWHNCPIIFISCLDDSQTIVSALEMGGDDFIVKPFDNHVLSAKIQASLRRVKMSNYSLPKNELRCSGFYVDATEHLLHIAGKEMLLTPMEFKLLCFFMQNPNRYFKATEVYKLVWGKTDYGDHRTVIVHVHALRQKIESDPNNPRYLRNEWGKGYIFNPELN